MRKRSGGIHATSEQEFIELAQASLGRIGIFYDDPKIKVQRTKVCQQQVIKPSYMEIQGFNWSRQMEYEEAEKKCLYITPFHQLNIAIVGLNIQRIRQQLRHQDNTTNMRLFDLIIQQKTDILKLKYWLLSIVGVNNILYQIYLKKAKYIIFISEESDLDNSDKMFEKMQNLYGNKVVKTRQKQLLAAIAELVE